MNAQEAIGTLAGLMGIYLLMIFAIVLLWLWILIDIIKSEFTENNKIIWILILLGLGPIGMILYLLIGRNQKVNDTKIQTIRKQTDTAMSNFKENKGKWTI